MFEFLIFILISWTAHGHPETRSITRIVGGKDAPDGLAPYQVSVRENFSVGEVHICGGSIINKQWVLSAANCHITNGFVNVVAGTNSMTVGGDRYNVSHFIRHENYDEEKYLNDISLLKIKGEFNFGDKINAIKLPTQEVGAEEECLVTGWGYTDYRGLTSDNLQMLTVKTISINDCIKMYSDVSVSKNQVCTSSEEGEGFCQGDAGGPLVRKGEVVGIIAWGFQCARGYPDVYTNVYAYLDWINRHISN